MFLHTANFYREKPFLRKTLHTEAFTHNKLLQRSFETDKFLHTESFYTQQTFTEKLLNRQVFAHRSFYTQQAFTQRRPDTEKL